MLTDIWWPFPGVQKVIVYPILKYGNVRNISVKPTNKVEDLFLFISAFY